MRICLRRSLLAEAGGLTQLARILAHAAADESSLLIVCDLVVRGVRAAKRSDPSGCLAAVGGLTRLLAAFAAAAPPAGSAGAARTRNGGGAGGPPLPAAADSRLPAPAPASARVLAAALRAASELSGGR